MEIIAAMIIFGLAEGIKENNAAIVDLQEQIIELQDEVEINFVALSAEIAASAATQKVNHDNQEQKLNILTNLTKSLSNKAEYLDEKINILHPRVKNKNGIMSGYSEN